MAPTPLSCSLIDGAVNRVLDDATLPSEGNLWVGFSGGLDSTVLLHALSRKLDRTKMCAVHVHHGLSANADEWATHCERVAQHLEVKIITQRVHIERSGDGLEADARQARYDAFLQHSNDHDAWFLGHHQDDQIETFFMRLLRGAGLAGLSAMSEHTFVHQRHWLRPLLSVPKAALYTYAQAHELTWVDDESNADCTHERNWWRNRTLPTWFGHLEERYSAPHQRLANSIEQLSCDQACLVALLQPKLDECVRACEWPFAYSRALDSEQLLQLPADITTYVVRAWLASMALSTGHQSQLTSLVQSMSHAKADANPEVPWGGGVIRRYRQQWFFCTPLPTVMPASIPLDVVHGSASQHTWLGKSLVLNNGAVTFANLTCGHGLKAGKYKVCCAQEIKNASTARIKPRGRPHKTLKHLWQEAGVPPWLRAYWPVVMQGHTLVSVVGCAVDEAFATSTPS